MSDEIQRTLGRIEGQLLSNSSVLEAMSDKMSRHFDEDREFQTAIVDRVGKVEKKVWWATGALAACTFIVGKLTGKI